MAQLRLGWSLLALVIVALLQGASATLSLRKLQQSARSSTSDASSLVEMADALSSHLHAKETQADKCNLDDLKLDVRTPKALSPLHNPKLGNSCCSGRLCPFANGVCCDGSSHCCPSGSVCVKPCTECPFICKDSADDEQDDTPQSQPQTESIGRKVVKVEVFNAQFSREREGKTSAEDNAANEQKKKAEQRAKRLEEQRAKVDANRQSALDKVFEIINLGVVPPVPAPAPPNTTHVDPTLTTEHVTPVEKKSLTDEELAKLLGEWPPVPVRLIDDPDGKGDPWIKQPNVDWLGYELIRNGTFNRVSSVEDCKSQCMALLECRLFRFVSHNGECWLDSHHAYRPSACPLSEGQRNCVSYLKKYTKWDANYQWGRTDTSRRNWFVIEQQNWLGHGNNATGGRLIRNGRQNVVKSEIECVQQCSEIKYCRSALFLRPSGECWLSSKVAKYGTKCARREDKRDCVTWVKKKLNPERNPEITPEVTIPAGLQQTVQVEDAKGGAQTLSVSVPKP